MSEITREQAERDGWTVEYALLSGYGFAFEAWSLLSPDGEIMNGEETGNTTEGKAWGALPRAYQRWRRKQAGGGDADNDG